jgi:hypothetical protein
MVWRILFKERQALRYQPTQKAKKESIGLQAGFVKSRSYAGLKNQHGVAITEKAVFVGNGLGVNRMEPIHPVDRAGCEKRRN